MRGICKLSLERKIPEIYIITYIHTCMCICKLEIYYKIKSNDFIIKQNAIILLIWKLAIWRSHFEIRPVCCFKSLTITTNSFSSACDPWDFTICIRCKSPSMPNRSPDGPKDCQSEVPGPKTPFTRSRSRSQSQNHEPGASGSKRKTRVQKNQRSELNSS